MRHKKPKKPKLTVFEKHGTKISPVDWLDWLPDLLPIAGLLEDRGVNETVQLLRSLAAKFRELGVQHEFDGTVPALARCLADLPSFEVVRAELVELFCTANRALVGMFPIPLADRLRPFLKIPKGAKGLAKLLSAFDAAYHGRHGRGVRVKLVHLMMRHGSEPASFGLTADAFARITRATDEEAETSEAGSLVYQRWVALATSHPRDLEWALAFWVAGIMGTPCLPGDPNGPVKVKVTARHLTALRGLDRVWAAMSQPLPKEPSLIVGEVLFALVGRIWRFAHHVMDAVASGNGEMAEIACRCQWDSYTTFRWLVRPTEADVIGKCLRFKEHHFESLKERLEYVRKQREAHPQEGIYETVEKALLKEIAESGQWELLIRESSGTNWSGLSAKDMATGIDDVDGYYAVFKRASDIVHGSWRALTRYHTMRCINPLHKHHQIPYSGARRDAGITPLDAALGHAADALWLLGKYTNRQEKAAGALRARVLALLASSAARLARRSNPETGGEAEKP